MEKTKETGRKHERMDHSVGSPVKPKPAACLGWMPFNEHDTLLEQLMPQPRLSHLKEEQITL